MKTILLITFASLAMLVVPSSAKASLGGDINSVQADRAVLRGTLKSTPEANYSVQQIRMPNGVTVREYVSPSGSVFGVSWQGPTRPNLPQVLGAYFSTFTKAISPKMRFQLVRGPVRIQANGLVVEMSGHMRWYVGRAYVQQMIPAGVRQEEIR